MAHQLPQLPYSVSALEPHIDARTMEIHHDKHHAAYIAKLNAALGGHPALQDLPVEKLIADLTKIPEAIRGAVRNHGGGHANHTLFWELMAPGAGGEPTGALAVPVWLALPAIPHWAWLLTRDDSPWYPTMRLFRQQRPGDWSDVFERIARALRRVVAARFGVPSVNVAIAPAELIDKITILEIKNGQITDPDKLANVRKELALLTQARDQSIPFSEDLAKLTAELKSVNEAIWQVEDAIRGCERSNDFGARFIDLARSIYSNNDRRAAVKRTINQMLGAGLFEEKVYAEYAAVARQTGQTGRPD